MVFAGLDDFRTSSTLTPKIPKTPKTPKSSFDDETAALLMQQFLDKWHYRIMTSSMGKKWPRARAVRAALQILIMNGLQIDEKELDELVAQPESVVIERIVSCMPPPMREHLDHLNLQLLMVLAMLVRIRDSCETGQNLSAIMEESSKTGIGQQVLKQSVVSASQDIANLHRCRITWTRNMDQRLERLTRSQEFAEHAHQQLMALSTQSELCGFNQHSKNKVVLHSLAQREETALKHSCFSSWLGLVIWGRDEKEIRAKFKNTITDAEEKLSLIKAKAKNSFADMVEAAHKEEKEALSLMVWSTIKGGNVSEKAEAAVKAQVSELETRLEKVVDYQAKNTMQVFTKVARARENALFTLCMNAWVQSINEFKQDAAFKDHVETRDHVLKQRLGKQKRAAQRVLRWVGDSIEMDFLQSLIYEWQLVIKEEMIENRHEEEATNSERTFKSLNVRQKRSVHSVQGRVTKQAEHNLLTKVVSNWNQEAKISRLHTYYSAKMESKRRQLNNVQTLFKSFAQELESGLGSVEGGDSSGRTKPSRQRRMQESVSLPDINKRYG